MDWQQAAQTLILALAGGGTGTAVVTHWLKRGERKTTSDASERLDAAGLRKELWERLDDLEAQIKAEQKENMAWRNKYYDLWRDHITLSQKYNMMVWTMTSLKENLRTYQLDHLVPEIPGVQEIKSDLTGSNSDTGA